MDLKAVASELYGLAPRDFTKVRDARASEAKRAGDRGLARAIGKLRRSSVSAWLANVLVRECADQVQSMLDLGAAIRQAQAQLSKDELRQLQRERRRVIAALLEDAAGLARHRGENLSIAAARDLETTLEAALLDPEATAALKTGALTTGLRYAGLGWSGATDDPSPSADTSEREAIVGRAEGSGPPLPPPDQARSLVALEAQREAEAQLAQAERRVDAGKRRVDEAKRDRDLLHRKVADLERQLDDAKAEVQQAEHRLTVANEDVALAEQDLARRKQWS
jgi:DNA repair exonuclease SbcCD ATPase subunit